MASLKDLKKRIGSVKNTQKITRAMKLVSAAKLRRATDAAVSSRPYQQELSEIIDAILKETAWESPLTEVRPVGKVALIVVSTDRGLCGSLNTNLFKKVNKRIAELAGTPAEIFAVGKKAKGYYTNAGVKVVKTYEDLIRKSTYAEIEAIVHEVRELFLSGDCDRVEVFYNEFKSVMIQIPTLVQLLPYALPETSTEGAETVNYKLEPEGKALLDHLVPSFIDFQFFRFCLESIASEHGARMLAMDNATSNAGDMIRKLTLQRNRARQAAITTELMEIIGGADALAG